MQRLRGARTSLFSELAFPSLRRKAVNSFSAVQDTYLAIKDVFERHRVVFTISTSMASVATAWAGYSLRYLHQAKVEERLESIENAMNRNYHVEHEEIKKIVNSGSVSTTACAAAAGTSLIIGYGLGWRGGKWYASRKLRKEQMKLLGQIKPQRWQFLRGRLARSKGSETAHKLSEVIRKDAAGSTLGSQQVRQSC